MGADPYVERDFGFLELLVIYNKKSINTFLYSTQLHTKPDNYVVTLFVDTASTATAKFAHVTSHFTTVASQPGFIAAPALYAKAIAVRSRFLGAHRRYQPSLSLYTRRAGQRKADFT